MSTGEAVKTQGNTKGRRLLLLFAGLCVLGLGLSIELTRIHFFTHTDPTYQSICSVSETINCKTVAQSPYSVLMGVPVSVWGILGYAIMGILAVWGATKKRLHDKWPFGALAGLSLVSLGMSSFLAYVSFTKIDAVCLFCTGLYAVNFGLLCTVIAALVKLKSNPFKLLFADIKALFAKPADLALCVAVPIVAIAALLVFIEPYWQHPGWVELPKLESGVDENGCHWIGAEDALVTIVEFSDYQCPYCRRAHKEMRFQAAKFPDSVRLIHSHMPLDQACNPNVNVAFHPRACEFSKAAECAASQGKFWEMNDALFSTQETIKAQDVDVELLAVQLGLDRSSFKECMDRDGIPDCIREDMEKANSLKVPGTPWFFLNSQSFKGGIPPAAIKNAVERARKKSE